MPWNPLQSGHHWCKKNCLFYRAKFSFGQAFDQIIFLVLYFTRIVNERLSTWAHKYSFTKNKLKNGAGYELLFSTNLLFPKKQLSARGKNIKKVLQNINKKGNK